MTSLNDVINNAIPFTCGKCLAPLSYDGYLCDSCGNEREPKKGNRYGVIRHEGVEYACDCCGSGSDEKGNRWILQKSKHDKNCSYFGRKPIFTATCDCPNGSTVKPDGTVIFYSNNHSLDCQVYKKFRKQSVNTGLIESYSSERVYK